MTESDTLAALKIDRRGRRPKRRRWPWWLAAIALLAVVLFVLAGRRPLPVETATVRAADDGPISVLDSSGYVTARRIATVSSKVTGKVAEVLIEEGQQVADGQLLARLDDTDTRAQLALAEAELGASRSQLGEARAQLTLATQQLARTRDLAARKLVPQASLDQAQAEHDARAAHLVALQQQVEVAERQVALAKIAVDNTEIRAPFAGVIVAKAAQPGEMISPISAGGGFTRTGIGTLVDMDSLEVQVDVNEANIGRVEPGQPVEAVLNAYPDWRIPGSVIAIIPTADRSKATVKVRIALGTKDPRIVPDMGVRVSFLEDARTDAEAGGFWLPARALVGDGAEAAVFVLRDGHAVRVPVRAGATVDADRRVHGALVAGEPVILSPPRGLDDGRAVQPKTP